MSIASRKNKPFYKQNLSKPTINNQCNIFASSPRGLPLGTHGNPGAFAGLLDVGCPRVWGKHPFTFVHGSKPGPWDL